MRKNIAMASLAGAILCGFQTRCPAPSPSVYQVDFNGKAGTKIYGMYTYYDPRGQSSQRIEKIDATLPYTLTISPPAGVVIAAGASASIEGSETVSTTIAKDGVECTKPVLVGSGTMNIVTCGVDL
jgi:hypothetical protein